MAGETFGEALRRLRGSQSLRDVARSASVGKSYIDDLEKDRKWPSREIVVALDAATNADGELIAAYDAGETSDRIAEFQPSVAATDSLPTLDVKDSGDDGEDATDRRPRAPGGDPTNRRDALRLGVAALATPELLITSAEHEARELTRRSEETDLGPSSLAYLHKVIGDYGLHYARYSADELWRSARGDRRQVAHLLQLRMTLKQRRELYIAAAWLSLILAWAAHDRGDARASLAYAADARHHAGEADHHEAVAWAWDVEATTLLYADRPDEALSAAQQGAALASRGSAAHARLTGQLVRGYARLGRSGPASDMLKTLRDQAEHLSPHSMGLFSADAARVWSVAATSSLWLGHVEQARDFAEQAMQVYERDPQASPTRRAIAALDLGVACARLGNAEQAVAHGSAAISTPRYAAAIFSRSTDLASLLERSYPQAAVVAQFRQGLAELGAGPRR
ncbi:helix-turn-helix domain-containing protein [Nonomuraea basaltis]|uniref:helix-turn-helix domain-containing protein n=1 Tax=Nonomuraea basaltis TaxID=2495887 RepID=UPI001487324F|nr:helix-turn-helix transcriptional regulator [Nonomuraea basaltis]